MKRKGLVKKVSPGDIKKMKFIRRPQDLVGHGLWVRKISRLNLKEWFKFLVYESESQVSTAEIREVLNGVLQDFEQTREDVLKRGLRKPQAE